ncbi:MAG: tetratricopeptide repeat protein, partial [Oscillatoriales cyanobacterium]
MKYLYRAIALCGFVTVLGGISPAISIQPSPILIVQNSAEDLFNSGLAKSEAGDIPGAIADYTAAIAINPNYAKAYNKR